MELDKTHGYYCQVQHEMFVCDTNFWDFIVWTPKELAVVSALKDEKFITEYTQNTHRLHTEYTQNTHRIHTEYTQNTHRIHTEYTQNTHRIHTEYTQNTHRNVLYRS